MESVEVSAKSVEEAVQQALIRLGKGRDEVDVTILSEGHRGILGFVRGDSARVRVAVRKPSSGVAVPRPASTEVRVADTALQPPVPTQPQRSEVPVPRPGDSAVVAKDTAEELLEKMGIDADVIFRGGVGSEDSPIHLDIAGEDLGILIGRRGETLSSLQFLLNLMVGKRLNSWVRVLVDVEGYRARREESLRSLAERVAERVRRTGQPVVLEPMPANERRIVHLAVQDNPHVTTESSGFGEDRRVTVMPRSRS